MSEHIQRTIEDLEQKAAAIGDILEKLRWFQREFPHTAAAVERVTEPPAPKPRRRAADKSATNGKKPQQPRPTSGSDDERILQSLRAAAAPVKPKDLAQSVGLTAFTLRVRLKALAKQKLVALTGTTAGRRVALPGKSGKEGL